MAWLTHLATGIRYILSPSYLVGRSHACALRLHDRRVSGEHASFRWSDSGWLVRDLHSRNGTFVNERRLEPGEAIAVSAGAYIAFGDSRDLYTLTDDSPPVAIARRADGTAVYAQEGILCLPSPDAADYLIFEDAPGRWFVETMRDGACRRLHDREELSLGEQVWRIELPLGWEQTSHIDAPVLRIADIGLRFRISRNEEYVEITIRHRDQDIVLEPRAHGYLLITLARERLHDRTYSGFSDIDHGWIDVLELMRMLDTTETMLNVAIHRARAQFREANVVDAARLIERRRGSREVRLGVSELEVLT